LAVICEWLHADDTFCLGLELLRVEVSFGKAVDDHLADACPLPLIATVLKEHVHEARCTHDDDDDDDAKGHSGTDCYQNEQVVV